MIDELNSGTVNGALTTNLLNNRLLTLTRKMLIFLKAIILFVKTNDKNDQSMKLVKQKQPQLW
jgi:hypothetical protein